MPSENIYLCINTLQVRNAFSSELSYIFSCFVVITGKIVVPLHCHSSDGCWVLGDGGHYTSVPPSLQNRFKSVPYIKDIESPERAKYIIQTYVLTSLLTLKNRNPSAAKLYIQIVHCTLSIVLWKVLANLWVNYPVLSQRFQAQPAIFLSVAQAVKPLFAKK